MIWLYGMLIIVAWQKGFHNRISLGKAVLSKVEQISLLNDYLEFLYDIVHFESFRKGYICIHVYMYI